MLNTPPGFVCVSSFHAALSVALELTIFGLVPRSLWVTLFQASALLGDVQTRETW